MADRLATEPEVERRYECSARKVSAAQTGFQTPSNEINDVIPPVDQEVGGSTPPSCTNI